MLEKKVKKLRRHKRVRAKIHGTAEVPRLCVFRSNKHLYAQMINDDTGKTIASAKGEKADEIGKEIAKKTLDLKITKIVFDRSGYKYHGKVKAIAEAARTAGLKF